MAQNVSFIPQNPSCDLEPCAHCGADAELHDTLRMTWWVQCVNPECGVQTKHYGAEDGREMAIRSWNRRAVGVIVPPCKVGDFVYVIPSRVNYDLNKQFGRQNANRVYKQTVGEIRLSSKGYYVLTTVNYERAGVYLEKDFAKTWFLTKEEAEQALKERESSG